ncbi:MAG TPA: type IV toxin-antitoxin system AbiEi family antitoxin domain-containing protein, partial [Coriobacteriia bacterium]|nr:type IV toxin-antitoxin system AbiEi family antitoxin domain-containing protein [Coriobacteriia bacterium]
MPTTLDALPATFEQRTAAKAGFSSTALHRHLRAGRIERIGRGLYRQADAAPADLDLLTIAHRSRQGTICLTSALAHHGLIDDIPAAWDIAIPRGTTPPKLTNVRWHTFD